MDTLANDEYTTDPLALCIIEPELFHAYKPTEVLRLTGEKITSIFALDCFNEAKFKSMAPRATPASTKARNFYQQCKEVKPPRSRVIQTCHERFLRELTGNLNKINGSNIDVMVKRIDKLVDATNIKDVVDIIMCKACTNGSYMSHFLALLDRIPNTSSHICTYIDAYIAELDTMFNTTLKQFDYEDYDQFCKFLKQKNVILCMNLITIKYMGCNVIEYSPTVYLNKLFDMIDDTLPVHLQDTLVQMVADFLKSKQSCSSSNASNAAHDKLGELYHASLESFLSSKSKFVILDIMTAYDKKNLFVCKSRGKRQC